MQALPPEGDKCSIRYGGLRVLQAALLDRVSAVTRPKFFRDPLHLQIRFDLADEGKRYGATLLRIIDSGVFQRLRFVRQNGLANLVFHGAEHSRFAHSMGVMHVARTMYERISRNMSEPESEDEKFLIQVAGLVHDVGHGPFSHTMEEVLKENGVDFHHENMTKRFILEDGSEIFRLLSDIDPDIPDKLMPFFDKKRRVIDSWQYRIVSSQMDADRLDYVQRDALFAGLRGHGFDIERVFDLLFHHENSIAVDRGAIEAVEAYLVTMDQLYRAIYNHHAVRAATQMLLRLFRRAVKLHQGGNHSVFPPVLGASHPMSELLVQGDKIELDKYLRLTDAAMWSLIDVWQFSDDQILSDLSSRIVGRRLFKTISIDPIDVAKTQSLIARAEDEVARVYGEEARDYYVMIDEPTRTSYKGYDWRPDTPNESIWLTGGGQAPRPLEDEDENAIVTAFKQKRHFPRLVLPEEVREALRKC
ncbi:HD domain-containing protein [Enterovirga rhinocerotis]|uniref:HD/PDEase domain-containing protein n=1 Tax=Enterovirga rhinocerotis TaxID=1339210 RepID=A0A4V6PZM5_9HYPH|nr:HD domain-containing protein [Enterovirga rhinocerotis]TDR93359.1 hypothetical protein EV668_0618 [Enterovirga rhinocerotis]